MLTPNLVILISSGVSVVSLSSTVLVLWPPPPNVVAALSLCLMAMMSVPAGFLLRAYINVILAIERAGLSPEETRRALDGVTSSISRVFDKPVDVLKQLRGGSHDGNH